MVRFSKFTLNIKKYEKFVKFLLKLVIKTIPNHRLNNENREPKHYLE